jgi:hypothetical protein
MAVIGIQKENPQIFVMRLRCTTSTKSTENLQMAKI